MKLTRRQCDVLDLLIVGYTYKQAAHQLHISPHTVTTHLERARQSSGMTTLQLAVHYALTRERYR